MFEKDRRLIEIGGEMVVPPGFDPGISRLSAERLLV